MRSPPQRREPFPAPKPKRGLPSLCVDGGGWRCAQLRCAETNGRPRAVVDRHRGRGNTGAWDGGGARWDGMGDGRGSTAAGTRTLR